MTSFDQLAADFLKAAAEVIPAMRDVFHDTADEAKKEWQDSADATVAPTSKYYSRDITFETQLSVSGITAEVGPEDRGGKGHQGFLGKILEFGGEHSPAYLHGLNATQAAGNRLDRRADAVMGHLLP